METTFVHQMKRVLSIRGFVLLMGSVLIAGALTVSDFVRSMNVRLFQGALLLLPANRARVLHIEIDGDLSDGNGADHPLDRMAFLVAHIQNHGAKRVFLQLAFSDFAEIPEYFLTTLRTAPFPIIPVAGKKKLPAKLKVLEPNLANNYLQSGGECVLSGRQDGPEFSRNALFVFAADGNSRLQSALRYEHEFAIGWESEYAPQRATATDVLTGKIPDADLANALVFVTGKASGADLLRSPVGFVDEAEFNLRTAASLARNKCILVFPAGAEFLCALPFAAFGLGFAGSFRLKIALIAGGILTLALCVFRAGIPLPLCFFSFIVGNSVSKIFAKSVN